MNRAVAALAAMAALTLGCTSDHGPTLYVSTLGDDAWSGRLPEASPDRTDGPFATLERARDAVRELKNSGSLPSEPIVVSIRGGMYLRTETFRLSSEDSGTAEVPIVWRAEPGEDVRILGGKPISSFRQVSDAAVLARLNEEQRRNVWVSDLKTADITDYGELKPVGFGRPGTTALELFFNQQPMQIARYPNEGWLKIESVPQSGTLKYEGEDRGHSRRFGMPLGRHYGRFVYPGDRPKSWAESDDLWVHGYWSWDWNDQYQRIERIDKNRREIYPAEPYHYSGYTKEQRFYFLNILEELDRPGEYYVDRDQGALYFWPPSAPNEGEALVSLLEDWFITLDNTSHITIEGLTLEASRAGGIQIKGGSHNKIAGCTIRNLGQDAVHIKEGEHNGVVSSDIYGVSAGINMTGGDIKTITPANNYVVNNHIHHYSRITRTYQAAVILDGVGNRIAHNYIHHAPHNAVNFSGLEHTLEFNHVHDVGAETGDVGAFYNGRGWSHRGNVIRHNYFHDIMGPGASGASAVYLDNWASGTTVFGNIFSKVYKAVTINGGRETIVENNVFVKATPAVRLKSIGKGWASFHFLGGRSPVPSRLAHIDYRNPPYSEKYPELLTLEDDDPAVAKHNKALRNVSYGGRWLDLWDGMDYADLEMEGNLIADPELAWRQQTDYTYTYDKRTDKITYHGKKLLVDEKLLQDDKRSREALTSVGNVVMEGNPGFLDVADGNFELKEESKAHELGFQPIPFEKIGLHVDEYRKSLPGQPD